MPFWELNAIKFVVAVLVGAIVGVERELRGKPAGVRTMILIALGSTLFTIFSMAMGGPGDPARIAAQIVTGVGFLGAGAILHDRRQVTGLTTAASIWLVASLGIGIGLGEWKTITAAVIVVLFVLLVFAPLERWFDVWRHDQTYRLDLSSDPAEIDRLRRMAGSAGLKVMNIQIAKERGGIRLLFRAVGKSGDHREFVQALLTDPSIRSFSRLSHNRGIAS
jgi:putative Mg2+ transporter-C (MgtC) family protein